jgi:putative FmdB family regulatory protein
MPLFAYRCRKCNKEFDVFFNDRNKGAKAKCPDCKVLSPKIMTVGKFRIETGFEPGMFEDFADKPIHFETKAQMEKYCRDNNLGLRKMPGRLK